MLRKMHKNVKGYYLVEILITLVILSIGLLGASKLEAVMLGRTSLSKQRLQAITIAETAIEQLRNYQSLKSKPGLFSYEEIISNTSTTTGSNATYNTTWNVTDVTDPKYKIVDIVVTWQDTEGSQEQVQLSTIIEPNDPILSGSLLSDIIRPAYQSADDDEETAGNGHGNGDGNGNGNGNNNGNGNGRNTG